LQPPEQDVHPPDFCPPEAVEQPPLLQEPHAIIQFLEILRKIPEGGKDRSQSANLLGEFNQKPKNTRSISEGMPQVQIQMELLPQAGKSGGGISP
jgi:hypothetical protein